MRRLNLLSCAAITIVLAACPAKKPKSEPTDAAVANPVATDAPRGPADAEHGKALVGTFECSRCHEATGVAAAEPTKHCVNCHKDIAEDRFNAAPASLARWKPRVKDLTDVPTLESTGKRFTRRWVADYLLQPADLRPHLKASMPRLALSAEQARDIAAYLVPADERAVDAAMAPELAGADLGKGRHLLETKGCGSCHGFAGVAALLSSPPPTMSPRDFEIGHRLAPDLSHARERMTPAKLVAWLRDPVAVKADTKMPRIALTNAEVKDLAGYIEAAELAPPPRAVKLQRLPVLTRKVAFKEVDEQVFHRTCWHCHSEPDYAIGDGGPGNSGGLGFKPRGLNLSAYAGVAAGILDDKSERHSIFAKDAEGVPRLVRALLARHDEEGGAATGAVRGMPLGYAPLSSEDIQLVETWVAQGRPK